MFNNIKLDFYTLNREILLSVEQLMDAIGFKDKKRLREVEQIINCEYLEGLIKKYCSKREAIAIKQLFFEEYTEQELTKRYNITVSRIHFIKNSGIKKLKRR